MKLLYKIAVKNVQQLLGEEEETTKGIKAIWDNAYVQLEKIKSCIQNEIEKLYSSMIKVMKDAKTDRMFCMRCYGHYIYFEKLIVFDDTMYRKIDVTLEIPNTSRKLKAFIKEIPSILGWKETATSHALNLNSSICISVSYVALKI